MEKVTFSSKCWKNLGKIKLNSLDICLSMLCLRVLLIIPMLTSAHHRSSSVAIFIPIFNIMNFMTVKYYFYRDWWLLELCCSDDWIINTAVMSDWPLMYFFITSAIEKLTLSHLIYINVNVERLSHVRITWQDTKLFAQHQDLKLSLVPELPKLEEDVAISLNVLYVERYLP